ncbi:NAD(P)/FAD-dependent oxidoreductase [Paragemmobacter straminiformis]|uniref:FAD-dependent oxidoreductase n=1 Tax=Paragemmobacter straminiformis TaxID=2045119 RepID=A0A842ICJ5_9RHOB|nr:FAD-dependent oxidoreductase [Gemmobacter straminiformis]MBC2837540.1 FAD-dependent oxidoreductase [Gemmobacter straminiformis]
MARVDLTVMGAGIFGLSIAWEAARRGARVRVIDPSGAGAGASGGLVGALAPHVPENWNPKKAFQLDSLLMASDWWAAVEAAGGQPAGYLRSGRLQPLADAAAVQQAQARAVQAETLWQGRALWQVIPATGATWEPPSPAGFLVHDTLTARLSPRRALAALLAALAAQGAEVARHGEAEGAVLWATGAEGLRSLSDALGKAVGAGVKGQALALRFDAAGLPQLFADTLHIVPHADGTVAIGSTSENRWADPGFDAAGEALLPRAVAALPCLAGAPVVARWAGIRPRAKTRAPMLGQWPDRPGHYIANGGFKIGFGMAPKVASVMADLVLNGQDHIPAGFRVTDNL